jgi:hypothetical protein
MNSWRGPVLALQLAGAGCGGPGAKAPEVLPPGAWHTFSGSWTASGTRSTLHLGPDHQTAVFHLNGSLLLIGEQRLGVGFQAEVIGFSDTRMGMVGRAVWTDERGDQVFSELKGEWVGTGNRIVGTLLGGTGRYAGVAGEYEFQWQYVLTAEDGSVTGRAVGLTGRVRVGTPADSVPPAGGQAR